MSNILITSAGRRVSLVKAFMHELKHVFPTSKVIVSDMSPSLSAAAQIAQEYFQTYHVTDKNYIEDLLQKCIERSITLIIPTIDTELGVLAKHKAWFLEHGITVVVPDIDFVQMASDKLKSNTFFADQGIQVINMYEKDNYSFPVYIKPINGSNSVDNYVVYDKDGMRPYFLENEALLFFEYIDKSIYDEYTCDLYYDRNSKLKCVIPRKRIAIRGGEVAKTVTCKNKIKAFIESKFSSLHGVFGCICLQVFMHKEKETIIAIEINPRFGGGYPLSYFAGGNFPKWLIEEYMLNKTLSYFDEWEDGLLMLRYDKEVLINNYDG